MKPLRNPKERNEALEKALPLRVFYGAMLEAGLVREALRDDPEFREWFYEQRKKKEA